LVPKEGDLKINNLKKYRTNNKYTQEALAEKVNISKTHYQNIEYGKAEPSVVIAIKLANALNTEVESLFNIEIHQAI